MNIKFTREVIEAHWDRSNAKEWVEFAKLLHPDLRYEVPQTGEYIESSEGYLEMFQTWPGDWTVNIKNLVCEKNQAICVVNFFVGNEVMTGISIFEVAEGLILRVTDYWPQSYEPPTRETKHMKRHAQ